MSTLSERRYRLDELATESGVSARTVRYYVQRGLLPAPEFRGRDTTYGPEHLARLRAIKRLQEAWLPLDQIQTELEGRTEAEIDALAIGRAEPAPPAEVELPPASEPVSRWRRWVIAPGLEIHLADDADEATRALAHELHERATRGGKKGRSR